MKLLHYAVLFCFVISLIMADDEEEEEGGEATDGGNETENPPAAPTTPPPESTSKKKARKVKKEEEKKEKQKQQEKTKTRTNYLQHRNPRQWRLQHLHQRAKIKEAVKYTKVLDARYAFQSKPGASIEAGSGTMTVTATHAFLVVVKDMASCSALYA
uniref:Putative kunitz n=1 Tax=Rhipicephalus microplus TaxID=6941 RepID=A0A6G5A2U7_RHIMP